MAANNTTAPLTITVRCLYQSRRGYCNLLEAEYSAAWEKVASDWTAAWAVAFRSGAKRNQCKLWSRESTDRATGSWFIDITPTIGGFDLDG